MAFSERISLTLAVLPPFLVNSMGYLRKGLH